MAAPMGWKYGIHLTRILGLGQTVRHGTLLTQFPKQVCSVQDSAHTNTDKKKKVAVGSEINSPSIINQNVSPSVGNESDTTEDLDALFRVMEVEVRGHDPAVLKSYEWFALEAAKELEININKTWVPPKHIWRRAILKSAFVHKKHQVQYEIRTYFRVMQFKHLTGSTASTYLEYIQRNLPEGVAMKVTKHTMEKIPEYIQPST